MKIRFGLALCALVVFLSGCASAPQQPVHLTRDSVAAQSGRIGVVMTAIGNPDTRFPGADCLFCIAAASIANSSLTTHTKSLTAEDLPDLKKRVADLLRKQGADVSIIDETLDLKALKDFDAKQANQARKNFAPLQQKYQVDKLLVIDIAALGFIRSYSAYIPTSDPLAQVNGTGFLVNLKTNAYEWYLPLNITKSAEQNWDEPPKFPGLTNAYYQALELGKDQILDAFRNDQLAAATAQPAAAPTQGTVR